MTLQLRSPLHLVRKDAVVTTFLSCQSWEWYPLFHTIIHSLQPTALLAVDSTMKLPRDLYVKCEKVPSQYAYVEPTHKEKEEGDHSSVKFSFQTARPMQLTLTRSLRRSSTRGSKRRDTEKEDVAEVSKENSKVNEKTSENKLPEIKESNEEYKEEPKEEPKEFTIMNGSRVTPNEMKDLCIPNQPYHFVVNPLGTTNCVMGVMIVRKDANHYTSYLDLDNDDALPEQKCPEPFIYEIPPEPDKNYYV